MVILVLIMLIYRAKTSHNQKITKICWSLLRGLVKKWTVREMNTCLWSWCTGSSTTSQL